MTNAMSPGRAMENFLRLGSPSPLQRDYRALVDSGLSLDLLTDCLCAKIGAAAHLEYGTNDLAGAALGVSGQTVSRWIVGGRNLSEVGRDARRREQPVVFPEAVQPVVERISIALYNAHAPAEAQILAKRPGTRPFARIVEEFEVNLAAASLDRTQGRKGEAARVLGVHRNWITKSLPKIARLSA